MQKLLKPCQGPFLEARREHFAEKRIILLIQGYGLEGVLNMYPKICRSGIEFEERDSELLWDRSHLNFFG